MGLRAEISGNPKAGLADSPEPHGPNHDFLMFLLCTETA